MATGMETVGLVGTVASLLGKAVQAADNVRTAQALSEDNRPLCAALTRQLGALTKYVKGMQCTQAVELDALGPVWAGALAQLTVDVDVVENKLRRVASPQRGSGAVSENMSELEHAEEVGLALQFAAEKLGVAWDRLQALDSQQHAEKTASAHAETAVTSQDHVLAQSAGMTDVLRDHSRLLAGNSVAKDCAKASELYQRVADGGGMHAVYELGWMYEHGDGVAKDCAKACDLYQLAADGGDMDAVNKLGLMYEHGTGVAKDFAKARELYQRAADCGDMRAVRKVGSMYFHGNGVAKDYAKAHELYNRAADSGDMRVMRTPPYSLRRLA